MGPKGGNYVDQKLRKNNRSEPKDNNRRNSGHNRRNSKVCRKPKNLYKCVICDQYHALRSCRKFLKMDVAERRELVASHHHCINCLARSHTLSSCHSKETCKKCDAFHHTLLHQERRRAITTVQLRNRQQQRQNKKKSPKPRTKRQPANEPQASTTPDPRILSEAIKSLAVVLCASSQF